MGTDSSFETEFEYRGKSVRMKLPSREDHISRKIVTDKTFYECAYLEALADLLDEGDMVLDVGANIGNHTVYLAGVVGCRVHAFEPIPSTFEILEQNIRLNGLGRHVESHMLALGDGEGHAEVATFDPSNLGATTLRLEDHGDIAVSSIDHLNLNGPVRLIKVDAEGMDAAVLAGARALIQRDRPVLACEAASAAEYGRLQTLLDGHGYVPVACYNATDTYVFLPASSQAEREVLIRYGFGEIIGLQRNAMAVQLRFAQAGRFAERVAKEQGERVAKQVMALQTRLEEALRDLNERRSVVDAPGLCLDDVIGQMRKRLLEEKALAVEKLEADIGQLTSRMSAVQGKLRDAERDREAAERDVTRLREELSSEIRAKRALEQAARAVAERANRQLMELGRSITFQVGSSFVSAMCGVRGLMKLPVRLSRIRREMKRRRELQQSVAGWNLVVPVQLPQPVHWPLVESSAQLAASGSPEASQVAMAGAALVPHEVPGVPEMPAYAEGARMAVIMDEFTYASYAPCCQVERLHPETGIRQLEALRPHVMFVESAWQGENGEWERKVRHGDPDLLTLIQWCRRHRIPTAFWNKEDPVHFETFMSTAGLFDYVFTTDIDCISRYKSLLGHERVYLLPFACQPRCHNPIEKYERRDAACFAGAYYVRYPERQRDFDTIIRALQEAGEVDIYDRNFGKTDVNYMFPESYASLIKGGLAFDDIDVAYKGYRYGVNLNSVKQSQTMFARRVFDLLASNTVTISNFSRGLRLLFGDLVLATDSGPELQRRLAAYVGSERESNYRKFRLLGLRKVLGEHTYADRLAYIMSKMGGTPDVKRMPVIHVLSHVASREQATRVVRAFRRQTHDRKHLFLLVAEGHEEAVSDIRGDDISLLSPSQAQEIIPGAAWHDYHLAVFSSRDYYGPAYLTDLAQATLYSDDPVIGKASYYQGAGAAPVLLHDGRQYKPCGALAPRRSITNAAIIRTDLGSWCCSEDQNLSEASTALAIDEFNYLADSELDVCPEVDDLEGLDTGLPLQCLLRESEGIKAQRQEPDEGVRVLSAGEMFDSFNRKAKAGKVEMLYSEGEMTLVSALTESEHAYLHSRNHIPLDGWAVNGEVSFHLDAGLGLFIQPALIFLDAEGNKAGSSIKFVCRNTTVAVPERAVAVQLALRVAGAGNCRINRWALGNMPWVSSLQMSKAKVLVVTNVYPSYEDLYRNGFVHRRVKGYERKGLKAEVFCLRNEPGRSYREFENIDVTTGWKDALRDKLQSNRYQSILVHFLDENMWDVLQGVLSHTRMLVWVHGFEIQHWKRRIFNYTDQSLLQKAKRQSDRRMVFWNRVLAHAHPNLHFIFVSRDLADTALEDLGADIPVSRYSVIHNFIDGDLFSFSPKSHVQRKKVLSIRPYATRMYANDQLVQAILKMSDHPEFTEMEFRIIGDGPLFEETLAPLAEAKFPNVVIERGFLSQTEIASLHKEYGIFMVPTRWDSQGVSRDEAMASGLVPVTNAVAAISEFVDDTCGLVVPPEDADAMAEQILALVRDPRRFQVLSEAAATRVRNISGFEQTIGREFDLLQLESEKFWR